ncbi:MAG: toll/interleukin-1 receptor domain-containing protein [Xanthobacteraceae bacterium]
MSTLAELPEIVGFFSYSREDDEAYKGRLSALREAIQQELGAQLGRSKATFRLWQDKAAIAPGKLWESEINNAVTQSAFFIPIVTPRMINSRYCKFEFDAFLVREKVLARSDLIFPILYVPVAALQDEAQWRDHPVLSIIGKRQYVDWQLFRYSDVQSPAHLETIAQFCATIADALRQPIRTAEGRQRQEPNSRSRPSSAPSASDSRRLNGLQRGPERPSGSYRALDKKPESPTDPVNRATPSASKAAGAEPKSSTGRFGAAVAKVMKAPGSVTEQVTIFGLPLRMIVPIAGGVALIASLAGALLFLMPAQGSAVSVAAPIVHKLVAPNQSAEALPPRSTNADPPLILNSSELYQNGSPGFSNLGKQ